MLLNSTGRLFQSLHPKRAKISFLKLEVRVLGIRIGKFFYSIQKSTRTVHNYENSSLERMKFSLHQGLLAGLR